MLVGFRSSARWMTSTTRVRVSSLGMSAQTQRLACIRQRAQRPLGRRGRGEVILARQAHLVSDRVCGRQLERGQRPSAAGKGAGLPGRGVLAETGGRTVVVDDDLNLLDPTLTVGPTQLGWTFPTNAAAPQTATLTIGNAGSGSIDWSASSDVPWLTLDVVSGTAPSTIVVTADPSGIPNGTGVSGHVIVSANSLTQTITIPAGLVVGSLFDKSIDSTPYKVLLPLILK